jgi:hypothetical protein
MENLNIGDYVTVKTENSPEILVLRVIQPDGYMQPIAYECGWFTPEGEFQKYEFAPSLLTLTRRGEDPTRLAYKVF